MPRAKIVTRKQASNMLCVTDVRLEQLRHFAKDQNLTILEVTDQVIEAGIKAIKAKKPKTSKETV